jgi:nitric-oxide synthase, brain
VACETFCLEENDMVKDGKKALGTMPLSEETVRFGKPQIGITLKKALENTYRKQLSTCKVMENKILGDCSADRTTIFIDLEPDVSFYNRFYIIRMLLNFCQYSCLFLQNEIDYEPGDHVGIMPCNRTEIVEAVLKRLDVQVYNTPVQVQVMKETLTPTGRFHGTYLTSTNK